MRHWLLTTQLTDRVLQIVERLKDAPLAHHADYEETLSR